VTKPFLEEGKETGNVKQPSVDKNEASEKVKKKGTGPPGKKGKKEKTLQKGGR